MTCKKKEFDRIYMFNLAQHSRNQQTEGKIKRRAAEYAEDRGEDLKKKRRRFLATEHSEDTEEEERVGCFLLLERDELERLTASFFAGEKELA